MPKIVQKFSTQCENAAALEAFLISGAKFFCQNFGFPPQKKKKKGHHADEGNFFFVSEISNFSMGFMGVSCLWFLAGNKNAGFCLEIKMPDFIKI